MLTPEEIPSYLAKFDLQAAVTYEGKSYSFPEKDLLEIHYAGDVGSSWFQTSMVSRAKSLLHPPLPREQVLLLCARTMKITVADLEGTLEWNANYMAWHDGGSAYENHVWPG